MTGLAASRHAPGNRSKPAQPHSPAGSTSSSFTPNNALPPSLPQSSPLSVTVTPPTAHRPTAAAPTSKPPIVTTTSTAKPAAAASAAAELSRFKKIIRRLQWKTQFLDAGYRIAIDRLSKSSTEINDQEMMFKLDFFEYYMLLERALVHLLGVYGLSISSTTSTTTGSSTESAKGQEGLRGSRWKQGHRYHANVLEALDVPTNPLHDVLGKGEVRRQLGRAKDLRNRWKGVDDAEQHSEGVNGNGKRGDGEKWLGTKKVPAPLESYDLANMLKSISDGFGAGFEVAERFVLSEKAAGDMDMFWEDGRVIDWSEEVESMDEMEKDEEGWEFMVDAMDWEAV